MQTTAAGNQRENGPASARREAGVPLSPEEIEGFLHSLEAKGRIAETLKWYRRGLTHLYRALPEDRRIRRGTLAWWRETLRREGYAPSTVNLFLSVANSYVEYQGCREYQLVGQLKREEKAQPELSREEYLRLLRTAKALERERAYLLVKVFASTGVGVQELPAVTVEAARAWRLELPGGRAVHVAESLCGELLAYAEREGRGRGPVFVDRTGKPMSRTNVTNGVKQLCQAAGVPEEKGSPRCLRRLYQSTREELEARAARWVDQAMDRILLREQKAVAWENPNGKPEAYR